MTKQPSLFSSSIPFDGIRPADWLAMLLLVVSVLTPYHQLLRGTAIPIPDDVFVSDLADGEFPPRVEAARLVRAGEWPFWTPRLFTGFPMVPDPLSLALFVALPPALALGWLIAVLLVVAAVGAYALARLLGASRSGAFLAGFAYSWSGVVVCQMRHLGEFGTIAYFPLALFCLEKAAAGGAVDVIAARALPINRRFAWLSGFAALFGLQILAGFPQSAYISALVYGALIAARAHWLLARNRKAIPVPRRIGPAAGFALGAASAAIIGTAVGMVQLLPLRELGALSDRWGGGTYEWATQYNYWPRNIITFFAPYANGDISNITYIGGNLFWEDYGYAGLATILLAICIAVVRARRFVSGRSVDSIVAGRFNDNVFGVAFWVITGVLAYGLVLGKATPLYRIAFELVPGLRLFRVPGRFLFVVDLAIALLGSLGLTFIQALVARHWTGRRVRVLPLLIGLLVVSATVGDLVHFNRRQNPLADAVRWLSPPASAAIIRASAEENRVFSPGSRDEHVSVFMQSGGWSGDLSRYYAHREVLQPNSNLLHQIGTLDGYVGIAPRWNLGLVGDRNHTGLLDELYKVEPDGLRAVPMFFDWLEALSVHWLIFPGPVNSDRVQKVGTSAGATVYRLPRTQPRARVVTQARIVSSLGEVRALTLAGDVDLRREVMLHDAQGAAMPAFLLQPGPGDGPAGEARIVVDRATEVVIEAYATGGGLLLLADTYYPGWKATVDGRATQVLRANVAQRAVVVPPGFHTVAFLYRPWSVISGLMLTVVGLVVLVSSLLLTRRLGYGRGSLRHGQAS